MTLDWTTPLAWMLSILGAAALVVPLTVLVRRAVAPDGVRVDHVVLFSFGFIFYAVFPVLLGLSHLGAGNFALGVWYRYFDANVSGVQVAQYLAAILAFYGAFVFGSSLAKGPPTIPAGEAASGAASGVASGRGLDMDVGAIAIFWPLVVLFGAGYVWSVRRSLFRGYTAYDQIYTAGGTLSAVALILLGFVLLRISFAELLPPGQTRRDGLVLYVLTFCAFAIVLLSLGGRLYVVTSTMMVLVYLSSFHGPIRYRTVVGLAAVGVVGVAAIGVIRLGAGGLSPIALAENIFGEPLFTSFSLLSFLGQGHFDLINVPRFLAGDLLNLVPSIVFPQKTAYLPDPTQYGYVVYAPLGALHMFFSFMINFGLIGSMVALGALGALLERLRNRATPLARVQYAMLSGSLAFTLFRDPFSVSLVKNMLEFSVLVPAALTLAGHVISVVSAADGRPSTQAPSTVGHAMPPYA